MTEAVQPQTPKRILIILLGSIGDVARGLALVDQLKAAYPQCVIGWAVEPKSAGVVALHPRVDTVIRFERGAGLASLLPFLRQLRAFKADVVLDLQRHAKSGIFSFLSGASRRIGFNRADAKEGNWLWNTEQIAARGESLPKIEHYLEFLVALGVTPANELTFGIDEHDFSAALAPLALPKQPYLCFVLGSAWESKDWFLPGYLAVLRRVLKERTESVLLLGDKSRVADAEQLLQAVGSDPRVLSLAGRTTIEQLVGVLQGASAVVGPDSGPGHLCGALGVPYVGLFGATDPVRTAPFGSEGLVLRSAVGCSPCYQRRCPGLGRLCMRLISPDEVFRRLVTTMAGNGTRG